MDDCMENGEFCQFYEEFFTLLELESQKIPLEHIKFKTVESIISKILGDKDFFVPTSTPLHKKFFERLEFLAKVTKSFQQRQKITSENRKKVNSYCC